MVKSMQDASHAKRASARLPKVAIACQGGGMHAAFEVGVLTEILKDIHERKRIELVGLSGTSAGALCALMVWYSLAPKNRKNGSVLDAVSHLDHFWEDFVAGTDAEALLNEFTYGALRMEELEIFGVSPAGLASLNPYGAVYRAVAASLPSLGVRRQYFDLKDSLARACPEFDRIEWKDVRTRLLIGATEVVNGFETVFDSDVNKGVQEVNTGMHHDDSDKAGYWRQRLPLSLSGVAASGTLPVFREAQHVEGAGHYWDGLYSQNPPVREFFKGVPKTEVPDELWILRINPQQWPETPRTNKDIQDRQNELTGNLSLNKELDFILTVNRWRTSYKGEMEKQYKHVTVRTIKMVKKTADGLSYASKFNRSRGFMRELRQEGVEVARDWLDRWHKNDVGEYPDDAAYGERR
jgi:NTE family protein